jgi:YfiH family protein
MAAVHAGWRGTVARIVVKTVRKMEESYHTHPQQLRAVIGPGISLRNFEGGEEVYNAFREADFPMDKIAQHYPVSASMKKEHSSSGSLRWHLDLPECNRLQLIDCGLEKEQIQLSDICTYDRCDEYFSARRLGINSGRIFTGILLKE